MFKLWLPTGDNVCGRGERLFLPAGEIAPFVRILEPLRRLDRESSSEDPRKTLAIAGRLSLLDRGGMKTGGFSH